jgi:hypothetical protein
MLGVTQFCMKILVRLPFKLNVLKFFEVCVSSKDYMGK